MDELESQSQSIEEKGRSGEKALNTWFKNNGFSYLNINQNPEYFANLFSNTLKRPDFLLLLESIGMIAIDAKNYTESRGEYTLPFEEELKRVITFERLFRIPVWYAYLDNIDDGNSRWRWISALKAFDTGDRRLNGKTKKEFIAIKLEDFIEVETAEDIAKLYTQRLSSLAKINSMIT